MQKLLKNKILIFLFILLFSAVFVSAHEKYTTYSKALSNWGIKTDVLVQKSETDKDLSFDNLYNSKNGKNGKYILALSSMVGPNSLQELDTYENIIFICDSDFYIKGEKICDYSNVYAESKILYENKLINSLVEVGDIIVKQKRFFFIPEVNMLSPVYRDKTESYFRALVRSNTEVGTFQNQRLLTLNIKNTLLYEATIYIIIAILFVVAFRKILFDLVNKPKEVFSKKYLENMLQGLISFLTKYSSISLYILLLISVIYVPFLIFYSFTHAGSFDFKRISDLLNYLLVPRNISAIIRDKNITNIILYVLSWSFLFFGFFAFIPNALDLGIKSLNKLASKKIPLQFVKISLFFSILLGVFMSLALSLKGSYVLLSFITFFILYLFYIACSKDSSFNLTFKDKKIFMISLATVCIVGLFLGFKRHKGEDIVYLTDIVGESSGIVTLPYSRNFLKQEMFNDFVILPNSILFVDNYAVFHPNYSKILNYDVKSFKKEGSFLVLNSKESDITKYLILNKDLREAVSLTNTSDIFYIDNFMYDFGGNYSAEVSFNCVTNVGDALVTLTAFYPKSLGDIVSDDSGDVGVNLIYFPGCSESKKEVVSYTIPLSVPIIPDGLVVFKVHGVDPSLINNITLLNKGNKLDLKFVDHLSSKDVLTSHYEAGDELNVYSFSLKHDYEITSNLTKDLNLGSIMNDLKKQNLLKNPFKIWTTAPGNAIIKNIL